jgi:amino acid transporter
VVGLAATTVVYVLVNWSYLLFIPLERMAQTPLVASTVMQEAIGPSGARFIAVMIACSAFGALNGYILTGARILYAMGQDHALFARLGTVHPRRHTPTRALWLNAAIAIALVCTKTFEAIMTYSTVVISVFFTMAVFGVILLRRAKPHQPRPYRAWGYPLTPILFCLTMAAFIVDVCVKEPREAAFGFALLALCLPLYAWCNAPAQRG